MRKRLTVLLIGLFLIQGSMVAFGASRKPAASGQAPVATGAHSSQKKTDTNHGKKAHVPRRHAAHRGRHNRKHTGANTDPNASLDSTQGQK